MKTQLFFSVGDTVLITDDTVLMPDNLMPLHKGTITKVSALHPYDPPHAHLSPAIELECCPGHVFVTHSDYYTANELGFKKVI